MRFGAAGGLEIDGSGLAVNIQGPGLAKNADGLQKVTNFAAVGWVPGVADDITTHDFPIARGSQTPFGEMTANLSVAGTASDVYVYVRHYCSGVMHTTFSEFQPSAFDDEVGIQLQSNYDNGGWTLDDRAVIRLWRQSNTFKLYQSHPVAMGSATAHTFQHRLVVTGGIASGTAQQGTLYQTFCHGIQVEW